MRTNVENGLPSTNYSYTLLLGIRLKGDDIGIRLGEKCHARMCLKRFEISRYSFMFYMCVLCVYVFVCLCACLLYNDRQIENLNIKRSDKIYKP